MSLRARLIAGMLVVSFVLVAVAFIIARTTEANLVDRVDQQLVAATPQLAAGRRSPGGCGRRPRSVPTSVYAARIQDGVLRVVSMPNVTADDAARPRSPSTGSVAAAVRGGATFTVSSTSGSGRYRVIGTRFPDDR